jgi:hypothetical protein
MPFQLVTYNRWDRGSVLIGSEDIIPDTALRVAQNVRLDHLRGVPTLRPGQTRLTATPLGGSILFHHTLLAAPATVHYAQILTALYRYDTPWSTPVPLATGLPQILCSVVDFMDGFNTPWAFFAGPLLTKDKGTGAPVAFGIAAPSVAPGSAVAQPMGKVGISTMDDVGAWVGTNLGGNGSITVSSLSAGGAGYAVGDTGSVTGGNGDATYQVDSIGGGGAVLTYHLTASGSNYQSGVLTTATGGAQPGAGAGLTISVTVIQAPGIQVDSTVFQEGAASLMTAVAPSTFGSMAISLSGAASAHTGTHTGANGLTNLTDGAATFPSLPVRLGSVVRNTTQGFEGTVTRIAATQLFFDGGLGGNVFNTGDAYDVYFDLDSFNHISGNASGTATGGSTTTLVDTSKNFAQEGVTAGMTLYNTSTGARGIITSLGTSTQTNDTLRCSAGFSGGSSASAGAGQTYQVVNDLIKDDDWLHLWVRVDDPTHLQFLQVDVDVETTTLGNAFSTNYYSLRIPPTDLHSGTNQWTELKLRKASFQRYGSDSTLSWTAARCVRLGAQTNAAGGVLLWCDDLSLLGGVGIEADGDLQYSAIWVSSATGGRSAPPKDADNVALYCTAITSTRQRVSVDLSNVQPGDPQVTHIWLYRRGGGLATALRVGVIPVGTLAFVDDRANVQLADTNALEEDNDVPPSDTFMLVGPGATNRLFALHGRNRVRFSKAWEAQEHRAEQFPIDFEFLLGDGAEQGMGGVATDQVLLFFTNKSAYQVQGTGPDSYIPLAIPQSKGLAAQYGLTSGDGQVFFLAVDGIYSQVGVTQTLLTGDIEPFFTGITVNGVAPLSQGAISNCRLAFHPHPQGNLVVLLYPESGQTLPNKRLVLKKNVQSGQYTDCFFDANLSLLAQSVHSEPVSRVLSFGMTDGHIYQAEVETVSSDAGVGIPLRLRTKAYDGGRPRLVKTWSDLVFDANTSGVSIPVTASWNRNTENASAGTIVGTTDVSLTELVLDQTARPCVVLRRVLALDLQATVSATVTLFSLGVHVQPEAEPLTFFDTGTVTFPLVTAVRFLALDIDTAVACTIICYIDGTAQDVRSFVPTSARANRNHYVPHGLVGRTLRVTVSAAQPFLLYSLLAWTKGVGTPVGYQPLQMTGAAG